MSRREKLYRITREIRRWMEWQGAEDEMGSIPASEQRREKFRRQAKRRRRVRREQIESSLRQGPPEGEQEVEAPGGDSESGGESEQSWRDLGPVRSRASTPTSSTPDSAGQTQGDRADQGQGNESSRPGRTEEAPKTNQEKLDWLRNYMGECRRCPLWENRKNLVFGEGDAEANLVFVGEAPGANEDRTGRPFVGRAGKLLDKMIEAMGLEREETYICNVLKSRPPSNRDPRPEEISACIPFLQKQLEIIEPEVIVTLGRPATQTLLESDQPLGALRGRWQDYQGIAVMPTYHPAYLLRSPDQKRKTWNDLQQVMGRLGL